MHADPEIIGLILSLIANISGVIAWYNASLKKRFASEAEWKKVVNQQFSIQESINTLSKEIKEHDDAAYKRVVEATQQIARKLIELEGAINTLSMSVRNKPITGWNND